MEQNFNNKSDKPNNMETNDLENQLWVKRLDMVFDKSSIEGIKLKEEEISEYVDFNKKYLENINEFLLKLKKEGYIFVCEPENLDFNDQNFFEAKPIKAEIVLGKINKIEFNNVKIINYGYGDPNKIRDMYTLEITVKNSRVNIYELAGVDLMRLKMQGSFVERNGDILALSAQKAIEALNKYYL